MGTDTRPDICGSSPDSRVTASHSWKTSKQRKHNMPNVTTAKTESLGVKYTIKNVPADVETFDQQQGKVGSALECAVASEIWRGVNPDARDITLTVLASLTGVPMKTKTAASPTKADPNRTKEVPDETDKEYLKRALAASGKTLAELQAAVDGLPDEDVKDPEGKVVTAGKLLDFNAPKRVSGPRTPGKQDTEFAEKMLGLPDEVLTASITALKNSNPGLEVEDDPETGRPSATSLAWAIKANRDRRAREDAALLLGGAVA